MKLYLKLCVFITFLKIVSAGLTDEQKMIQKSFKDSGLVPGVIPKAPRDMAFVIFHTKTADRGNKLTPKETVNTPHVSWPHVNGGWYTLVMIDPDAPSKARPTQRFWQHWTVANIPGYQLTLGETIAEYIGPMPPPGSGPHRYMFLVYKQPKKQIFYDVRLNEDHMNRGKWSLSKFVERNNLGDPIAGNYFISESK